MEFTGRGILTDRPPQLIVKIGGSLAKSGALVRILEIVSRSQIDIVIVPGGGVFADAVRADQGRLSYSDKAAHTMAMLAMHQSAIAMSDLAPRLQPIENLAEIEIALKSDRIPVWMPLKVAGQDHDIPQDWTITSDGLAARLAQYLNVGHVVLVKPAAPSAVVSAADLASAGVVDQWFAENAERLGLMLTIVSAEAPEELEALLMQPKVVARR